MEARVYPKRYIYFILDGQHALKTPNLLFSHIEVNQKLCKLIPQKTWDSQAASRLDFFGKVDLAKPSEILYE